MSSAEPPFVDGELKFTVSTPELGTIEVIVGADGAVGAGFAFTAGDDDPTPAAFTARSRTEYVVPLTSPVIDSGLATDCGLLVDHVVPLSIEN